MTQAIFITARLKSTRLPGKALIKVNKKPLIGYMIDRLNLNSDNPIYICTSTNVQDDPLEDLAKELSVECYRGSEEDVLQRYLDCAQHFSIDSMYITYADEPFVDIDLLKKSFEQMQTKEKIWIRNDDYLDGTFGYGFTFEGLQLVNNLKTTDENEVWGEMVSRMPLTTIKNESPYKFSKQNIRLTVDYPEDLEVFKILIKYLEGRSSDVSVPEIVRIYQENDLFRINGFRSSDYNKRIEEQSV